MMQTNYERSATRKIQPPHPFEITTMDLLYLFIPGTNFVEAKPALEELQLSLNQLKKTQLRKKPPEM